MINSIISAVKGEKEFNLEISLDKNLESSCCGEDLKCIREYEGKFTVTTYGYLHKGSDENLRYKRNARIKDSNFPKRGIIHFENGEMDMIVKDILGPRLRQTRYKKEKEVSSCLSRMAFA